MIDIRITAPDDCPDHVLREALRVASHVRRNYADRRPGRAQALFWAATRAFDYRSITAWWTAGRRICVEVSTQAGGRPT